MTMLQLIVNKRVRRGWSVPIIGVFIFSAWCAQAQGVDFEAVVDRNTTFVGGRVQLSLIFGGSQNVKAPELPQIDGFTSQYLGPSTRMSIINGQVSSSITHNYILAPLKEGRFKIGPFDVTYRGRTYQAGPITIEVAASPAAAQRAPSRGAQQQGLGAGVAEAQLKDRIFVELDVDKAEAFPNQIVPVTIRLYVNRLAIRDLEYPVLSSENFMKEDFGKPRQYQKELAGLLYDVIEFKTEVYPVKTGRLTLGPAEVRCNMVVRSETPARRRGGFFGDSFFGDDFFDSLFSKYESYPLNLKSTSIDINVKPFPKEDMPADFKGAIGDFYFDMDVNPKDVSAGDPVTVTMKISGRGNFATVNAPSFNMDTKGFKAYQPQPKSQDGAKVYEQALIPLSKDASQIPQASFSFFNPHTQAYKTLRRGPLAITVTEAAKQPGAAGPRIIEGPAQFSLPDKEEVLGRDIIYIKEGPGRLKKTGSRLYQNGLFVFVFPASFVVFLGAVFFAKRKERIHTDARYARALRAPKAARAGLRQAAALLRQDRQAEFYEAVFKTLQEYIGDRLHIPAGGITARVTDDELRPRNVDEEMLAEISRVFEACDAARFASTGAKGAEAAGILQSVRKIVDYLERARL